MGDNINLCWISILVLFKTWMFLGGAVEYG